MSALTPDCDPDLSNCGSPTGPPSVRSTVVLLALVAVAAFAVRGAAVPAAVAFLAGGVGLVSGLVLCARGVRLARRAGTAVAAHAPWAGAMHRSRPTG
ncbi:MAG: hypothetical protein M3Q47_03955 [Actinomycetota bacterium]|nr:hypothetical protein [Actinomycetota bacterium]